MYDCRSMCISAMPREMQLKTSAYAAHQSTPQGITCSTCNLQTTLCDHSGAPLHSVNSVKEGCGQAGVFTLASLQSMPSMHHVTTCRWKYGLCKYGLQPETGNSGIALCNCACLIFMRDLTTFTCCLQSLAGRQLSHGRATGSRPQAEAAGSSKKEPAESVAPKQDKRQVTQGSCFTPLRNMWHSCVA